jgi:glutaryl-CoA dehydrogenase
MTMTKLKEDPRALEETRAAGPPYPEADFLFLTDLLTEHELNLYQAARTFFQLEVRPIAVDHWNRAEFPFELLPKLAAQQLSGLRTSNHLLSGLIQMEFTRAAT